LKWSGPGTYKRRLSPKTTTPISEEKDKPVVNVKKDIHGIALYIGPQRNHKDTKKKAYLGRTTPLETGNGFKGLQKT